MRKSGGKHGWCTLLLALSAACARLARHACWRCCCRRYLAADAGAAEPEVGTAVLIKKKVTGKLGTDERRAEDGLSRASQRASADRTAGAGGVEARRQYEARAGPGCGAAARRVCGGGRQRHEIDRPEIAQGHAAVPHRQATPARATRSRRPRRPSASGARSSTSISAPDGDTFVLLHQGRGGGLLPGADLPSAPRRRARGAGNGAGRRFAADASGRQTSFRASGSLRRFPSSASGSPSIR